jgi:hypothetical protein
VSKKDVSAKLVEVKLALARKCDRLVQTTHSIPRRKKLMSMAGRFRRQAADLTRK